MDEADKLRTLKKAYADIILNTAKEAASRIMVTERKALKFEQQLFATKEESLRMLLRIKQVMDAKITEAEIKSIGQQQLIEELEAQLHEAEDIVRDLRAELREVQDQLERVAVRQLRWNQPILKVFHATHEEEYQENERNVTNSVMCHAMDLEPEHVITYDVRNSPSNSRNEVNKCQIASDPHPKNQCLGDPDFSALVMVNKDPELSRNGCAQRIRAFERNSVDENLSLYGKVDGAKNERIVSKDAKGEGTDIEICRTNLSSFETSSYPDNKNHPSEENCSKIIGVEDPKEADSHWASRDIPHTTEISMRSGGANGNLLLYDEVDGTTMGAIVREDEKGSQEKPGLGMDISCSLENELNGINQNKEVNVKEPKRLVIPCKNHDNQVIEMSQASHPSPCKSSSLADPVNDSVSLGHNPPTNIDTELPNDPEPCMVSSYPLYTAEMDTKSGYVKANIHCTLINEVELNKQEIGSMESSLVRKTVLEMVKEPLKSDIQTFHMTTNETPAHAVNDRLIKYTFQRKRKKESLSSIDESSSFEDSFLKKNKVEDSHGSVDSQKSSSKSDSSRRSLRLAQVTRQVKLDVS